MERSTLLEKNREGILGKWVDRVIRTYPAYTSEFLAKQKDPFRNPVGHAINEGLGTIYDEIVSTMNEERLQGALDRIIRIRSVQDFSPSEAVSFIFQLKKVMRDVLAGETKESGLLTEIDSRIDRVALLAFDIHAECRERLHEARNNEIKNRSARLLERAATSEHRNGGPHR